jgi:hypothetical protein
MNTMSISKKSCLLVGAHNVVLIASSRMGFGNGNPGVWGLPGFEFDGSITIRWMSDKS